MVRSHSHDMPAYLVSGVIVANHVEAKAAIETNDPAGQSVEHFGERWMDIEIVFPAQVLPSKCAEMDLIEDDLVWVFNSPESDDKCQAGEEESYCEGAEPFTMKGCGIERRNNTSGL